MKPVKWQIVGAGNMGLCVAAALKIGGADSLYICDLNKDLCTAINDNTLPFAEPQLDEINFDRQIIAGTELRDARITLVCVQTPYQAANEGVSVDYRPMRRVMQQLHDVLGEGRIVVIVSTMFPGGCDEMHQELRPDLGFLYNPTFLATGSGVRDFRQPSKFIVGGEYAVGLLYRLAMEQLIDVPTHLVICSLAQAEWAKVTHNAFMANKIVFANEIGAAMEAHGLTGTEAEKVILACFRETPDKLLSTSHLMPGPPYSGQCLPKDGVILQDLIEEREGVLSGLYESNDRHITRLYRRWAKDSTRLGIVGMTFKTDYDDCRGSLGMQMLELAIHGVKVYDPWYFGVKVYDPWYFGVPPAIGNLRARGDRAVIAMLDSLCVTSLTEVVQSCDSIFVNRRLTDAERDVWKAASSGLKINVVDLHDNGL